MAHPVIAGAPAVTRLYEQHVGYCPYTYANDAADLARVIERLVMDRDYRAAEAARVAGYVRQYHDYPAVARRYEEILAKRLKRTDVFTDVPARAA
jgi:hypothetical protein